jgi:DNA adenine methylase
VRRYHEPFVGGGAVAGVYLGRCSCSLSDLNEDLMTVYRALRAQVEDVIQDLSPLAYDAETYYRVRDLFNQERAIGDATRAAWFLYLNRAGFNGLYRVNQEGQFNVPFGRYVNPTICDPERLRACARLLRGAALHTRDFQEAANEAKAGDFVFLDPPYLNLASSFTAYQAGGFGPTEQLRLIETLWSLDKRGVHFLLTNADTEGTRALFAGFNLLGVQVKRSINSKASGRGTVGELLVSNRPLPKEVSS